MPQTGCSAIQFCLADTIDRANSQLHRYWGKVSPGLGKTVSAPRLSKAGLNTPFLARLGLAARAGGALSPDAPLPREEASALALLSRPGQRSSLE